MEQTLIDSVAQSGVMGALLLTVMYWLARHFLPEHERQHREALARVIASHDANLERLVAAVEQSSRVVQYNSQALLMLSLTRPQSGDGPTLTRDEAEEIVRRIEVSTLERKAG
jgi:hypothetical protein